VVQLKYSQKLYEYRNQKNIMNIIIIFILLLLVHWLKIEIFAKQSSCCYRYSLDVCWISTCYWGLWFVRVTRRQSPEACCSCERCGSPYVRHNKVAELERIRQPGAGGL